MPCKFVARRARIEARPLDFFRNERNFCTRRPRTAQVAVNRVWREAQHANVNQRDDLTWISSCSRIATCIPESLEQSKKKKPAWSLHVKCCVCCLIMKQSRTGITDVLPSCLEQGFRLSSTRSMRHVERRFLKEVFVRDCNACRAGGGQSNARLAGLAGWGCGQTSRVNALSCHFRSIRWLISEVIAKIAMPRIEIRISAA